MVINIYYYNRNTRALEYDIQEWGVTDIYAITVGFILQGKIPTHTVC